MTAALPYVRCAGSRFEMGRAHGASCADLVRRHLELSLARLDSQGIDRDTALAAALEYRPAVVEHAPHFDEEIRGVADGAGITLAEAYLLQLRAEVYAHVLHEPSAANECTTFVATGAAVADGTPLAGQNADLPPIYTELMIVLHLEPDDGPALLMTTPAGQISYIGISDAGMAVFANFLTCDGWQVGFPRYLYSRYALEHGSIDAALDALRGLRRASPRNLIMLDATGRAVDFENTPASDALLEPADGLLAHANHYLSESLAHAERAPEFMLRNSHARQRTIEARLRDQHGSITQQVMTDVLRDRSTAPDALSAQRDDLVAGRPAKDASMTVASVIASPTEGRMWVCSGPPSQGEYAEFSFAGGCHAGVSS